MKNFVRKISLTLLVTASLGLSTANAAADNDAIALQDTSIYAVIGLAPVIQLNCDGVNMGIHRISATYTGTFSVTAANNATATASTGVYGNTTGTLSQTADSLPETGKCTLLGLTAPAAADYKLTLTGNANIPFGPGTSSDVSNPSNRRTAVTAGNGVAGMSMTFSLAGVTPALENTNDLVWRINGVATFASVPVPSSVTGSSGFGGYVTTTPATADVDAATNG